MRLLLAFTCGGIFLIKYEYTTTTLTDSYLVSAKHYLMNILLSYCVNLWCVFEFVFFVFSSLHLLYDPWCWCVYLSKVGKQNVVDYKPNSKFCQLFFLIFHFLLHLSRCDIPFAFFLIVYLLYFYFLIFLIHIFSIKNILEAYSTAMCLAFNQLYWYISLSLLMWCVSIIGMNIISGFLVRFYITFSDIFIVTWYWKYLTHLFHLIHRKNMISIFTINNFHVLLLYINKKYSYQSCNFLIKCSILV